MANDDVLKEIPADVQLTEIFLFSDVDAIELPVLFVRDFQCEAPKRDGYYLRGQVVKGFGPKGERRLFDFEKEQPPLVMNDVISPLALRSRKVSIWVDHVKVKNSTFDPLTYQAYWNGFQVDRCLCLTSEKELALGEMMAAVQNRNNASLEIAQRKLRNMETVFGAPGAISNNAPGKDDVPFVSTTVRQLSAVIADIIQVDADALQEAVGRVSISTSQLVAHDLLQGETGMSVMDHGTRTMTLLADRIPMGQEAKVFAKELVRHHGQELTLSVMGEAHHGQAVIAGPEPSVQKNSNVADNERHQSEFTRPVKYELTADDVEDVLHSNSLAVANTNGKSFKSMAEELLGELDFDLIEQAALAGDDLDEKTDHANDEIARQLREKGVLEPLKMAYDSPSPGM